MSFFDVFIPIFWGGPAIAAIYLFLRYQTAYVGRLIQKDTKYLLFVPLLIGIMCVPLLNIALVAMISDNKSEPDGVPRIKEARGMRWDGDCKHFYYRIDENQVWKNVFSDLIIISPFFVIVAMFIFL